MGKIDFAAIGDIVIDAFIQLSEADANVVVDEETGRKKLQMNFGDKLPYQDVVVVNAVGNSPNASVAAHRLGLASALVTNLGDDRNGEDCVSALNEEGVITDHVAVHPGKETNYHYVLRYGAERTILVRHHEYDYKLPDFEEPPSWMYLSSLGENSIPFHHEIATYVKEHPETKLVFQPGTFQIKLGYETLKDIYQNCELFFCNKEEAQRILESTEQDIVKLMHGLHERGVSIPVVTDGPNGAYAFDGSEAWFMPMYPDPGPPVDRTGAGDSFSSTFTSALALGKSIPEALSWGPINSMSVVQHIGAQKGLVTQDQLQEFLNNGPADYKPKKLE